MARAQVMVLKWEGVTLQRGDPKVCEGWEGDLWIDLDERIVGSQKNRAGSQTVVVDGSRTIPEAQNFA